MAKTTNSKPAAMAATNISAQQQELVDDTNGDVSMDKLVAELAKQRASLKEDMSTLIQNVVTPLQTSVNALRKTSGNYSWREL